MLKQNIAQKMALSACLMILAGCTQGSDQGRSQNQDQKSRQDQQQQQSGSGSSQSLKDRAQGLLNDAQQKGSSSGSSSSQADSQQGANAQGQTISVSQIKGDRDKVRQIQEALKSKGYDPGKVDGAWGPITQRAVSKYSQDQGVQSGSGQVSMKVFQDLGVGMPGSASGSSRQ